jgi:hypothetical protein
MKTMKKFYACSKHLSIKKNLSLPIFSLIIVMLLSAQKMAAQTLSLGNSVWWDFNNNGKKDGPDFGSNGFTVKLYQDNNEDGVADAGFTTLVTTTDADGKYLFTNLAPGSYFVRLSAGYSHFKTTKYGGDPDNNIDDDNNGYTQDLTTMHIYSQTITLTANNEADGTGATNTNTNNTCDFAMWKGNGLGDMVWFDSNENGMQEVGEPGMANVLVKLKDINGNVLETTTTDATGHYFFFNPVQYGVTDYQLEFATPSGYDATYSNMGADDEFDSDATNGIISSINVPFGQWNNSLDVGFKAHASILPVKLLSFFANVLDNKVDLTWLTTTEVNVSHYVVERSTDGINFKAVGTVFAKNSGDKNSYTLADDITNDMPALLYYRLRFVDYGAKNQYSDIILVRRQKQSNSIEIQAYPNPVVNELRVTIPNSWQNKTVRYELVNANGQQVKQMLKTQSNQTETLAVQNITPGIYIVKVSCGTQIAQQKIIKQ